MIKHTFKKTGYADIDELLSNAHILLEQGEKLRRDIDLNLQYKPKPLYLSHSTNKRFKKKFKFNK